MPSAPPYSSGPANGHHMSMNQLTNGGQSVNNSGGGGGVGSPHHHLNQQMLTNEECGIREVWANNLEEEFKIIRNIVQHYPYIAMDTEFPGVVARPIGKFTSNTDYVYQVMQVNVQLLKIIQLGLTFMDASGKTPPNGYSTWQFNFKFSLSEDMFAQESIDLLTNSGLQFKKHEEEGIDTYEFAVLLIGSGIVLSDNIYWLSFHSGYDFGYLLKLLTDQPLPTSDTDFFELLRIYFPKVYDLKYLMKSIKDLKGGLQEVAEQLSLERKGPQHQAGSDSLLTGETFFRMREMYFEDNIEEKRYSGFIYGLELVESVGGNGDGNGSTGNANSGGGGSGSSGNGSALSSANSTTSTTGSTSTSSTTTTTAASTTSSTINNNSSGGKTPAATTTVGSNSDSADVVHSASTVSSSSSSSSSSSCTSSMNGTSTLSQDSSSTSNGVTNGNSSLTLSSNGTSMSNSDLSSSQVPISNNTTSNLNAAVTTVAPATVTASS